MTSDRDANLPGIVVNELEQCGDRQLETIVEYAQRRLEERHGSTEGIEPRHDDETIVSTDEKDGYTVVTVVRATSGERIAYHVARESDPDSGEAAYRWRYLGPVGR